MGDMLVVTWVAYPNVMHVKLRLICCRYWCFADRANLQ